MNLLILQDTSFAVTTIDQKIAEWFNSLQVNGWSWGNLILCFLAVLFSLILCGIIGIEREKRGRSAGLRTHLLVGVGSAIIMIISIYGFPNLDYNRDVARLAAQVVAGVGFLGAGAIIHANGGIKGLTTASTIWLSMAIGLACGSMNFILAITGTFVIMVVLTVFRKFEKKITGKNPLVIVITDREVPINSILLEAASKYDATITDLVSELDKDKSKGTILETVFKINFRSNGARAANLPLFMAEVQEKSGAETISLLNQH